LRVSIKTKEKNSQTAMPTAARGALLQCDPPQMAVLRSIDTKAGHIYIIEEIDDRTCLVSENKVDEVKRLVKETMDAAMGIDDEEAEEKDSDLD
jgi:Transcription factor TFIIH complex subunit Tfb5